MIYIIMQDYLDNIFNTVNPNIKLDEEQREVIMDKSDNIMVIAGAGAGKTTVITAKVKYLIEKANINPEEILIISFTNKAIEELKDRINDDFNLKVDISTFHSFAYNIIKKYDKKYKIIVENEKILKKIILNNKETRKIMNLVRRDKIYKKEEKKYNSPKEYFVNFTVENFNLFRMKDLKNIIIEDKIICKYMSYLSNILLLYNDFACQNNFIDFEDMIIKATTIIDKIKLQYKYIIIDEFQDISLNRYNLIKKIAELYKIKTMVVGDDWQAIYSFAGSDNNLFLNYAKDMNAKVFKITKTYRNSQELIDIAGNFVMKNKKQIHKQLISNKKLSNPIVIYKSNKNFSRVLKVILEEIIKEYGSSKNVLILGRYKKNIDLFLGDFFKLENNKIIYKYKKDLDITFLTIHSSKGLGYDNVILLMISEDELSFPNQKKESKIRINLLPKERKIMEERRLFYVAITRTKNKVFIISSIKKESEFIKEISKESNVVLKKIKGHKI